jgi:lipoprotein-anchoring transpeptidase ErfK/SrfK
MHGGPNYFYGGYAVHGMTSVPAYPASHGCVRMTVPTMDRMWSSLSVGMPVAIYTS